MTRNYSRFNYFHELQGSINYVMVYDGQGGKARVSCEWWEDYQKTKKAKKKCPPIPWGNI